MDRYFYLIVFTFLITCVPGLKNLCLFYSTQKNNTLFITFIQPFVCIVCVYKCKF